MAVSNNREEKNREAARTRYHANREEFNALRRKKYAKDKGTRDKARQRAADYRKNPPTTISRQLHRELNGKLIEVFSTGQVAALLEQSPQTLRNWEREGLVPKPIFSDKQRLYTKQQCRLLEQLRDTIKDSNGSLMAPKVRKKAEAILKSWS